MKKVVTLTLTIISLLAIFGCTKSNSSAGENSISLNPGEKTSKSSQSEQKNVLSTQNLEGEATSICSKFVEIYKDCYLQASKGVLPPQVKLNYEEGMPKELVDMSCKSAFEEYEQHGHEISVNQVIQIVYKDCHDGYVKRGHDTEAHRQIMQAYTAAQAYFQDEPNGIVTLDKIISYGFQPSEEVTVVVIDGTLKNLVITSKHRQSSLTYLINASAEVKEI
jgi:hypothetical protein